MWCPLFSPDVSQWLVLTYLLNNHGKKGRGHAANGYLLQRWERWWSFGVLPCDLKSALWLRGLFGH